MDPFFAQAHQYGSIMKHCSIDLDIKENLLAVVQLESDQIWNMQIKNDLFRVFIILKWLWENLRIFIELNREIRKRLHGSIGKNHIHIYTTTTTYKSSFNLCSFASTSFQPNLNFLRKSKIYGNLFNHITQIFFANWNKIPSDIA